MNYRKLRIAWSVGCGILCILLIVLWVRSYWWTDSLQVGKSSVASTGGRLLINDLMMMGGPASSSRTVLPPFSRHEFANGNVVISTAPHGTLIPLGVGRSIPAWLLVAAAAALTAASWFPSRFSLRHLLIAITLVAVGLGVALYATTG